MEDLTSLQTFIRQVQSAYVDGVPLHIAQPEQSVFKVMTEAEFDDLSINDVQNILQKQHLVLTNVPGKLNFDRKGLGTLQNVSNTISIQGESSLNPTPLLIAS